MIRLTASKLELASHCQHWRTLEWTDTSGPAALRGIDAHATIEAALKGYPPAEPEPWMQDWSRWWERQPAAVAPVQLVEQAFAIDINAGKSRPLKSHRHRDYTDAKASDICLTVDLAAYDHRAAHAWVWDWKTGKDCGDPAESWQLGAAAVAVVLAYGGIEAVTVGYRYIRPKRGSDKSAVLTTDDLADRVHKLRQLTVLGTDPHVGEHCDGLWCPARKACARYQHAYGKVLSIKDSSMGRMSLGSVSKGKLAEPLRVLAYGIEGVGKSSFGAGAPSPIFISSERGTAHLDVARFPEPDSWSDVVEAVETLMTESHTYQTLVIDTLDWLEPLLHAHLCQSNGWESIDKPAFAAGYNAAQKEWRKFADLLGRLQDKTKMHVVMLAHANVRKHQRPDLDEYDRFELSMHKKSAAVLKEWSTDVLFCDYITVVERLDKKGIRTRATGGARVLRTEWRPSYDAKNRHQLPDTLPLSWDDYFGLVSKAVPLDTSKLLSEIDALLSEIEDEDLTIKVRETIKGADAGKLAKVLNRLRAKAGEKAA